MTRFLRFGILGALLMAMLAFQSPRLFAQEGIANAAMPSSSSSSTAGNESVESEGPPPVFEPEHGTWFNVLARTLFASSEEKAKMAHDEQIIPQAIAQAEKGTPISEAQQKDKVFAAAYAAAAKEKKGEKLDEKEEAALHVHYVAKYDFLLYTALLWVIVAVIFVSAAKKIKIRPEGKPSSTPNLVEAAVSGFQDYLIGVMGNDLARKYTPLIASFFFTILFSNWLGLVPGLFAASAQPAIPISLALVAFLAVHVIAIKETGLKSWFMHFVGEPIWLAPLNFPLHLVGELIKPLSLSLRLLCNVFGEEAVIATLVGLAISFLPVWLPIPFQLPMLFLGTFFGFLQALVFSTLLSIYISIFATHHDDGHGHSSTEHAVDSNGHHHTVGHAAELMVG